MSTTLFLKDLRQSPRSPVTAKQEDGRQAVRPQDRQAAANRPWDRVTVGFWLGGVALGIAGCLFGACLPYRHPVAVTISTIWWSIYFGCFGCWLGALIGTLTKRTLDAQSSGTNKEMAASD
jgi:hypothetical protein